jgi:hypothetical protein
VILVNTDEVGTVYLDPKTGTTYTLAHFEKNLADLERAPRNENAYSARLRIAALPESPVYLKHQALADYVSELPDGVMTIWTPDQAAVVVPIDPNDIHVDRTTERGLDADVYFAGRA